jgi:hypothetical protein
MINNPFFYLTSLAPYFCGMLVVVKDSTISFFISERKNRIRLALIFSSGLLCLLPATEWSASAIRAEGPVAEHLADYITKNHFYKITFLYAGVLNSDSTNWYLGKVQKSVSFNNQGLGYTDKEGLISIIKENFRKYNLLVVRSNNIVGFPSDKLQNFANSEIKQLLPGSIVKPYRIGNYLLWSP